LSKKRVWEPNSGAQGLAIARGKCWGKAYKVKHHRSRMGKVLNSTFRMGLALGGGVPSKQIFFKDFAWK